VPTPEEVLGIVKLIEDLEPAAFGLVKTLLDRLQGATPEEVAAMAHTLNATAISEIDAELGKQS
jgi:hypothetical protein